MVLNPEVEGEMCEKGTDEEGQQLFAEMAQSSTGLWFLNPFGFSYLQINICLER